MLEILQNIYKLKRQLIFLCKSIWPLREVINNFIKENKLNEDEHFILLIALANEISSKVFDPFLSKNSLYDMPYSEFGGSKKYISEVEGKLEEELSNLIFREDLDQKTDEDNNEFEG